MPTLAPQTFTWERAEMGRSEVRGGHSDTPNEAGVRRWAEQILTAYRYGRDPDVLHEIWVDGNAVEQDIARRFLREFSPIER